MKALSIKQPWASLIAHGIKDIENRTWKVNFRGKIFIHASAKEAGSVLDLLNVDQSKKWNDYLNTLNTIPDKPVSAIIGEVEIIDCVIGHESIWAEHQIKKPNINDYISSGLPHQWDKYNGAMDLWYDSKPIYNLVLANAVLYKEPILNIKGALSFWEPKPNQTCMNCKHPFFGPEPTYCCNGSECGCMGQPTEPVVCSKECYDTLINKRYEHFIIPPNEG